MRIWEISWSGMDSSLQPSRPLFLSHDLHFPHCTNSANSTDTDKPISAGFYRLEPGTPLVYTYTYHEMKIIVSGDFTIADEAGNKVTAVAGDVFYFPKGSVITFTTEKGGLAFYTGQRAEGAA
jgi:ethanolamine utilization protein EutQ (cupin superfamily)